MMAAQTVVAKVESRTGSVCFPPPHPRQCDGNKGGGRVKAEATKRAVMTVTRGVSNDNGDGNGGKSDGDGNEGAGQATMWGVAAATWRQ